jgi:hypothetical protein
MGRKTRRIIVAALSLMLVGLPALAQDSIDRLYGSWRLLSFKAQIIGEDADPRDIFGPHSVRSPHSDPGAHDGGVSVPT